MAARTIRKAGATLGANKGYDAAGSVKDLRAAKVTPHVAQKQHSAIDARTTRHPGYAVSLKKRKLQVGARTPEVIEIPTAPATIASSPTKEPPCPSNWC